MKVGIFFLDIYELPRLKNSVAISYEYFVEADNFLMNLGISMNPNPANLADLEIKRQIRSCLIGGISNYWDSTDANLNISASSRLLVIRFVGLNNCFTNYH